MSSRYAIVAVLITFVLLYFTLHANFIGEDNGGSAHGQQGAHLAVARGYVQKQEGFDFSLPTTYAFNSASNDYPATPMHNWIRTAYHFPLHPYIIATVHSYTGWKLNSVFHVYNMLWGFVGLFFLYMLSLRITQNIGKSLFIVVFFGTAPLLSFFQSSTYPILPSLSCLIAGVYFLYRFLHEKDFKYSFYSITFLFLGSLFSPDFIMFFLMAFGFVVYRLFKNDKSKLWRLFPVVILMLLQCGYLEFNFLREKASLGSQFPAIFEQWNYDSTTPNFLFENWKMHYFTVFQTVVIGALTLLFALRKFRMPDSISKTFQKYQIALLAAPGIIYAIISPNQAMYSEVFFLKFLFLTTMFLVIFIVDRLNISLAYRYPKIAVPVFLFLIVMMIGEGNWTQMVRHEKARTSSGSEYAFFFKGGDELLARCGVHEERMLHVVIPKDSGIGHDVLANLGHTGIIREVPSNPTRASFPKDHYLVCTYFERDRLNDYFKTAFVELGTNGSIVLLKAID